MQPVIPTLNETSAAVIHLGRHLRLLKEVLGLIDRDFEIDVSRIRDFVEGVDRAPVAEICGTPGPGRQPALNVCNGVIFQPGATLITTADLTAVAERAIEWCDAISGALGDPIEPEVHGPTNS